jgi:hypothetical protein
MMRALSLSGRFPLSTWCPADFEPPADESDAM